MANEDQLAKLVQGAEAWNKWRELNQSEAIDLSYADLRGANLVGANLGVANLYTANLGAANLDSANRAANLDSAILFNANLRGANLGGANLHVANLRHANLRQANLGSANLDQADVGSADLSGADLSGVVLYETGFSNAVLTGVIGLETCDHAGPSTLDHRTFAKSGPLPLAFVRGCGLPESLITYLPSLLNQAIQFYSCFISYSTKDQEFADRLYADLQNKGVRCWFAPHDMAFGQKIHEQIDEAIRLHDKLLLILSEHSMNSEWVKTEIRKARKREVADNRRMLFPVSLVGFQPLKEWECFDAEIGKDSAVEIREYFIPDFTSWKTNHDAYKENFDRLVNSLQTHIPVFLNHRKIRSDAD